MAEDRAPRTKNGIRKLRRALELSEAEVAGKLGIATTELKRMEQGWDEPDSKIVADLAVLFQTDAETVLGKEIDIEDWQRSPFAAGHSASDDEPYGNLILNIAGHQRSYPICEKMRDGLLHQVAQMRPGEAEVSSWLNCHTLNNRLLFINPRSIRTLSLKSDDETQIDPYAHAEVYRLLGQGDDIREDAGPVLAEAARAWREYVGTEEAYQQACTIRVLFTDGEWLQEDFYLSDESVVTDIYAVDAHSFALSPDTFVQVEGAAGYLQEFVNLRHVALLEVPLERFLRRSAPETIG